MEINYTSIKSLIKKETLVAGNQIQLEFCAKNQQTPISTVAVVISDVDKIKKDAMKSTVKQGVKQGVISSILRAIGLGGILGSTVRRAATQTTTQNSQPSPPTKEEKEKAIVTAFQAYASTYKYNEETSEWEYNN